VRGGGQRESGGGGHLFFAVFGDGSECPSDDDVSPMPGSCPGAGYLLGKSALPKAPTNKYYTCTVQWAHKGCLRLAHVRGKSSKLRKKEE